MTAGTNKEEAEQLALAAPKTQSYLEGRQICKVFVVPERLVNIVCGYMQRTFTPLTAEVAVS
jgi:leucyl-tRNA synthetase